jgi:diadenosine tetraphosphate (Ap4A) HIT family hydrolase
MTEHLLNSFRPPPASPSLPPPPHPTGLLSAPTTHCASLRGRAVDTCNFCRIAGGEEQAYKVRFSLVSLRRRGRNTRRARSPTSPVSRAGLRGWERPSCPRCASLMAEEAFSSLLPVFFLPLLTDILPIRPGHLLVLPKQHYERV